MTFLYFDSKVIQLVIDLKQNWNKPVFNHFSSAHNCDCKRTGVLYIAILPTIASPSLAFLCPKGNILDLIWSNNNKTLVFVYLLGPGVLWAEICLKKSNSRLILSWMKLVKEMKSDFRMFLHLYHCHGSIWGLISCEILIMTDVLLLSCILGVWNWSNHWGQMQMASLEWIRTTRNMRDADCISAASLSWALAAQLHMGNMESPDPVGCFSTSCPPPY